MIKGEKVFHRKFGSGVIEKTMVLGSKKQALVNFGYTKVCLNIEDLDFKNKHLNSDKKNELKEERIQPIAKEPPRMEATSIDETLKLTGFSLENIEQVEARKSLLALRLGQIYEEHVFELSVGTDKLKEDLIEQIGRAISYNTSFILVEGAWGVGKTHAMTLLQALARKANFWTANIVMDGESLSLSDPMQLMEELLNSIVFHKNFAGNNFSDLISFILNNKLIASLNNNGSADIATILSSLPYPLSSVDNDEALSHLQDYLTLSLSASQIKNKLFELGCRRINFPTIRAIKRNERSDQFCKLIKNWSNLACCVGGKGLLVVIDELDVEYASTMYNNYSSIVKRRLRKEFLNCLRKLLKHNLPLIIAFASAPTSGDINHENDAVEEIMNIFSDDIVHIKVPEPNKNEFKLLLSKLDQIYIKAYGEIHQDEYLDDLFNLIYDRHLHHADSIPRQFVRSAIEALDLLAISDKHPLDIIESLR